ncbi:TNF receptor-associated factor 6-like isoform X2 [Dreissena polymorpha]|uniref:TNF receptor-associated factor 6-like isoform X2 n=1 Tax=Dreissena polymorpha TaxID=45954 RepID=UPI002263B294|nr:TNF receptor-associated factor 6-like isoform X2 [Dreissena polymorpha]
MAYNGSGLPRTPPVTGQYSSSGSSDNSTFIPDLDVHPAFDTSSGWDLEFVPQQDEKYNCSICQCVLREPMQTECGHRFCRACILKWLRESDRRCPVDNQYLDENQLFQDNFAKRETLDLKVRCPNPLNSADKEQRCEQIITLNKLQKHFQDCPYTTVLCPNCSKGIYQCHLSEHLQNDCEQRKIQCSLCHQEVVANKQKLIQHLNSDCPKAYVKCSFHKHGCEFEGERQKMMEHDETSVVRHVSMMNQTLLRMCAAISFNPITSTTHSPSSLGIPAIENPVVGSGAASFPSYFINGASGSAVPGLTQLLNHLSQLQIQPVTTASLPPISYTSMPIQSVSYAANIGGQETVAAAEGHDRNITGDEQGDLTNSEQRNSSGRTRYEDTKSFTSKPSDANNFEVPIDTRLTSSNDYQFMSIKSQNDFQNESLAKHDHELMILKHQMECQERLIRELKGKVKTLENNVQDFEGRNGNGVYVWKIKNYQKLRREAEKGETTAIHSTSFYSSFYGYKLCIRVNLNGVDAAKGTHLSLFIHFMQGEYDDLLEWPFSGKIVLTVIDQNPICEMRNHLTETLHSKPNLAAFQRPTSFRNHKGFGYMEFLPLNVIEGSSTYIKNDTLIIRANITPNS